MTSLFQTRVVYLSERLLISLSQFGYALQCNYAISNRVDGSFPGDAIIDINELKKLKNGDKFYLDGHSPNIDAIMNALLEVFSETNVKLKIIIACEPYVPEKIVYSLLPYAENMYLQNNIYEHPQIHNMPLGIRDGVEVFPEHRGFTCLLIVEIKKWSLHKKVEKETLCLLCYSMSHEERYRCSKLLEGASFVKDLNKEDFNSFNNPANCGKVPLLINYMETVKSWYALSPRGWGEATHRFFECIYLRCIPIVKLTNTPFDKLYTKFPCLIVNDWDEITETLLESMKETKMKELDDFMNKYPDLFLNKNLETLLNLTL